MTQAEAARDPALVQVRKHGNPYNIFILVTTIMSLAIMVALLLPVTDETRTALQVYDNIACIIFLIDFTYNLTGAKPRREYFVKGRGWVDLLGSIPSFGFFQFTVLLRLFRLSRLARISRLLRGQQKKELIEDMVQNRGQYALFVTLLLMYIVVTVCSLLVLQFETAGGGSIDRAGDAIWWTLVTITTVGYGDFYPITPGGRIVGVTVMFSGIALIGALASILASLLVSSSSEKGASDAIEKSDAAKAEAAATATTGDPAATPVIPAAAEASARVAAALKVHRGEATIADPNAPTSSVTSHELGAFRDEVTSLREEIAELRAHLAAERAAKTGASTTTPPPDAPASAST